jgi:Fic family protein
MDGNGRVGRFLMNTMMASGGYPWTVIPVTDRKRLRERSRKSECRRRYCALRGLPRRAGEKTTGGRALAGAAESFARRRTLKQFSICGFKVHGSIVAVL